MATMLAALFIAAAWAQGAAETCGAPAITAAEVTLNGDIRVTGLACPGQAVELLQGRPRVATLDAPAGGLEGLEAVGSSSAGDCGVFVATLRPLTMDTQLVARVGGADSAPRALTLSQWPEAVVETPEGAFVMRLFSDAAPGHVKHFVETALAHGYDGTLFHRVLPDDLVQGGDPISRDPKKPQRYGSGGLGQLKAEFSDRCFYRGIVGAVRCPSNCDSAGSQFFIALKDHPELRGQYTAFGEVVSGLEVVDRISRKAEPGQPLPRIPMIVTVRQAPDVFQAAQK